MVDNARPPARHRSRPQPSPQAAARVSAESPAATPAVAHAHGVRHRVRLAPASVGPSDAPPSPPPERDSRAQPRDYEVGYGKPPEHSRFKKGQSGNPRGRRKGARNLTTDLAEELQERILLKEGGKPKQVSKQRAMLKSLMARALQGDARSATLIVNLVARLLDQSEHDDPSTPLAADDAAILAAFEARIRNTTLT